jgi:hypothetical protein
MDAQGTMPGFGSSSTSWRSTPSQVLVTARAADFGAVVSVFSFQGRRIVTVKDYPSMQAAEAEMAGPRQAPG